MILECLRDLGSVEGIHHEYTDTNEYPAISTCHI